LTAGLKTRRYPVVEYVYREKRNTPRADDNTSVLPDGVTVHSPEQACT
jgi:hypothetical protein